MNKRPYLQHYIIEIFDLDKNILINSEFLKKHTVLLIKKAGLNAVDEICYEFNPRGATLMFALSTSHLSLHTWPENNYLHIDLLLCQKLTLVKLRQLIQEVFRTQKYAIQKISYRNIILVKVEEECKNYETD